MKVKYKIYAIIDILFAHKFELTVWDVNGFQSSKTKFDKKDFKNKIV